MAFDGFFTKKMITELRPLLEQGRINKINNISTDEFILTIRNRKNLKLLLSASATSSRIQLTKTLYENPPSPSNFCAVLRKYLTNGIILNIEQKNNDRIIFIEIKNFDDLGYESRYFLIVELMGKHSNFILTDSNLTIIEALKNSYNIEYSRSTIAGLAYKLPPTKEKIDPFDFQNYPSIENINNKTLINNFYGISKLLNDYIIENYSPNILDGLKQFCQNFDTYCSPSLLEINGKKDFYFFNPLKEELQTFENLSDLVDFYYMDKSKENINKNNNKELFNLIKNKLTRLENKLTILTKELDNSINNDDFKLKGELLLANAYLFKKNIPETVSLQNYYSETLEEINIKLDNSLSIEKNAEKYFSLYKKNKRTIDNLTEQIRITNQDITYFENLKFQIENAEKSDLLEIQEELINQGLLHEKRNPKSKNNKKNKANYFIVNYKNTAIYVGRNNIQNDTITNKLARKNYLWFHAKDVPGSHVVIFSNNPDEETINVAAQLAAYFSKLKQEDIVPVDMTFIKNVKKISGAKPGLVTYTEQTTLTIRIDRIIINSLINS